MYLCWWMFDVQTRDKADDLNAIFLQFQPDGGGPSTDSRFGPAVSRHSRNRLDVTMTGDHDNPARVGSDHRHQFSSDSHTAEEVHFHLISDLILGLPFHLAEDHHRGVIHQTP